MEQNTQTEVNNEAGTTAEKQELPLGQATTKAVTFFFKTDSVRDDDGAIIGKGRKHPDVKFVVPIPTFDDLKKILEEGGKAAQLLVELAVDAIELSARQQINQWRDDNGLEKDFTADKLDVSKLTLDAIANAPRSERGGPAISDAEWTSFLEDYAHVMQHGVGYEEKKVKLHVLHFKTKLARIKNDKPAVQKLYELLQLWATKTEALEENTVVFQDLERRAQRYLKAEDKNLAEAF